MNNEKLGQFIAEQRKLKQMTQKELAAKLNITDKAVSKWERGLSCPDISLLSSLAELLGVTVGELLNGEKKEVADEEEIAEAESIVDNTLQYVKEAGKVKTRSILNIAALIFSLGMVAGIITCAIIDIAMSGSFTWSLFPISATIFGWLVLFPVIKFGGKGIFFTMLTLSIFIIPFLFILAKLIPMNEFILPIGIRVSVIGLAFLWVVFVLFKVLKIRKTLGFAITLLLTIPVTLLINVSLSKIISEPLVDVWDVMSMAILLFGAMFLFGLDFIKRKKAVRGNL